MHIKKRLMMSAAALLMLGSSFAMPPSNVEVVDSPVVEVNREVAAAVSFTAVPVANAWDYSVWSNYQNGVRLGSLNNAANKFLTVSQEQIVNGVPMVYFTTDAFAGWVAREALEEGAYRVDEWMPVVENAWDYGIWTHFDGGNFIMSLNNYRGRELYVKYGIAGFAYANDGMRDLGWVAFAGLIDELPDQVNYNALAVHNAWDYSVWSNHTNGIRLGSLNDARNQLLHVTQEHFVDGVPLVYFSSPTISGWVAKPAIHIGGAALNYVGMPVANSWDYGIWSHFIGGTRLDSLYSYRGQQLTTVLVSHNNWVLVRQGDTIIGWVYRSGLQIPQ